MIALGITPGLHALGYSVLQFNGAPKAALLDSDTLHAGRGVTPRDAIEIARRCRAHRLVLDVVLDRHPPGIVVLGPSADPKERTEHVGLIRLGLMTIGTACGIQVLDMGDPDELYAALGIDGPKGVAGKLRTYIDGPHAVSRDRRVTTATASALAGALFVRA